MRTRAVLSALTAVVVLALVFEIQSPPAAAQDVLIDRLFVTIHATTVAGNFRFVRDLIVVGQVPTVVNVTVKNVDPTPGMEHTFTIRSTATGAPSEFIVDTDLIPSGGTRSVEFILWGETIQFGNRNETFQQAVGGGVKFFCRPHEPLQMIGRIAIGGVQQQQEQPEKGVFLRAYWIGLLGFAGTMLLVAISYFVIKGSSPRYQDHHEHIRRGGP